MADYDPNRLDPNRPDYRNARVDPGPGMNWNWILGGIAVVVVLLIALSYMGSDNRTAGTGTAPTTTGQSLPRTAPSTTGQSIPSPAPSPTAPSPSAPKQ